MTRLAEAIEAVAERDRRLIAEAHAVDRLRVCGTVELHALCRDFVDRINGKLSQPAVVLDPSDLSGDYFRAGVPVFFQINLRGRLLQFQFTSTEGLYGRDDFSRPYVLRGSMRSFNQDSLSQSCVDEQLIFYCPRDYPVRGGAEQENGHVAIWYFIDPRTHRTGKLGEEYLISTLERLL